MIFLLLILATAFKDYLFFKTDAAEALKAHQIELKDEFDLESNESGGFLDYSHEFVLSISYHDKERLIRQIKAAENFAKDEMDGFDIRSGKPRYSDRDTSFTANYHDNFYYVHEYYQLNERGYTPTWEIVRISKTENILIYEEILD